MRAHFLSVILNVVLLVFLQAAWSGPSQAQSKIVLCRLVNVPDQLVGGEILLAVYARLNIAVEFHDVEAARALALSSVGECDGEVQRVAKVAIDYPTLIRIEPPINFIEPTVFTAGLKIKVQGWDSIRDRDIGIVHGVGSSEAGTRGMTRVQRATSLHNLILMLDRGRFELLVTDLFSGEMEIRKMRLESTIRPLMPPLEKIYIYHYLHEQHRDLAVRVAAVIRDMDASGALAELRQQVVAEALLEATGKVAAGEK